MRQLILAARTTSQYRADESKPMETTSRAAWFRTARIRRRKEELAARVAVLAPANEFDDEYAPEEMLTECDRTPTPSEPVQRRRP